MGGLSRMDVESELMEISCVCVKSYIDYVLSLTLIVY
jgi:hypothetical protein